MNERAMFKFVVRSSTHNIYNIYVYYIHGLLSRLRSRTGSYFQSYFSLDVVGILSFHTFLNQILILISFVTVLYNDKVIFHSNIK